MILTGTKITLLISIFALVFGLFLGIIGSVLEKAIWPIRTLAYLWHLLIRGLPEIIVIFIFYFGMSVILSELLGTYIEISAFIAGGSALAIIFGAYASQIFIAASKAIDQGQINAAIALGMSKRLIYFNIKLPHIAKHAFPGLMNLWLVVLKDSAIVSVIGVVDIMRGAQSAAAETYSPMIFYGFAAILYLLLTSASLFIGRFINQKLHHGMENVRISL